MQKLYFYVMDIRAWTLILCKYVSLLFLNFDLPAPRTFFFVENFVEDF